ncbi:MAG: hypothetical protein ABJB12_01915 [Pseudomonadota bacterium]
MTDRATSKLGVRVAWTVAGFAASVALAGCAAHWYETPHLSGTPETPIWMERDVLCALASSAVALAVGASARRWVTRPGAVAAGSALLRGVLWALFSLILLAAWGHYLFLLTFVVAPSQAFAASRLLALLSSWRSELR